jgi:RimJ/RimL family protein N-acetyltransferase
VSVGESEKRPRALVELSFQMVGCARHFNCGAAAEREPTFYDRRVVDFVPPDFDVPVGLETSEFVLEPLGPEHNERDYDAWTSSMEHIAVTPGYPDGSWPREMTRDENRADLQRHADDFRTRKGFTYTVLDPASRDVIGCVYIYPLPDSDYDACALSWVRESHAHLDTALWRAVSEWLESEWPFASVEYAPRA